MDIAPIYKQFSQELKAISSEYDIALEEHFLRFLTMILAEVNPALLNVTNNLTEEAFAKDPNLLSNLIELYRQNLNVDEVMLSNFMDEYFNKLVEGSNGRV